MVVRKVNILDSIVSDKPGTNKTIVAVTMATAKHNNKYSLSFSGMD